MNGKSVSVVQNLRLVDVEQVKVFYVSSTWRAHVEFYDEALDAMAIPGTVTISSSEKNRLTANEINFRCSDLTPEALGRFTLLRTRRLMALYTDGRGNERISGSPTWPLSLTFVAETDGLSVTIKGTDTGPDPFRY